MLHSVKTIILKKKGGGGEGQYAMLVDKNQDDRIASQKS